MEQNSSNEKNNSINVTDEDMSFKKTYESATAAVAITYDKERPSPFVSSLGYSIQTTTPAKINHCIFTL